MSAINRSTRHEHNYEEKLEYLYFFGIVSPQEYRIISLALACETAVVVFKQEDTTKATFQTWTIEITRKIDRDDT